jgi:hypothetical protein
MHSGILAAWTGFSIQGESEWGWLLGIMVAGWLGIRWWSAQIEKQFERASPLENERVKNEGVQRQQGGVNWDLSGLLKWLLLLFVLACAILVTLL